MKQLIDKSALIAEIEKRIKELQDLSKENEKKLDSFQKTAIHLCIDECKVVLNILDTLEVKEVNLENSMTCEVGWYDGFLLDYTQEQQDELLEKIGANVGDKIKVILAKE